MRSGGIAVGSQRTARGVGPAGAVARRGPVRRDQSIERHRDSERDSPIVLSDSGRLQLAEKLPLAAEGAYIVAELGLTRIVAGCRPHLRTGDNGAGARLPADTAYRAPGHAGHLCRRPVRF
jgi:hypothetical protein